MASDYEGDPKEFAVVIPVPTFIERRQIGVVDTKTIDHLDAYTAPRLVEYSDPDPCRPIPEYRMSAVPSAMAGRVSMLAAPRRGVTVEASYDVAEYDVSILRRMRAMALSIGSPTMATGFRTAPPRCSAATSSRTCASLLPK